MSIIKINPKLCESINKVRLNLLQLGYASVGNEWDGEVMNPIYSRLYYIIDGEAKIKVFDNQILTMQKGNWYLLPVGCSFSYSCKEKLEHIFFHLKLCNYDGMDLLHNFNSFATLENCGIEGHKFAEYIDSVKVADYLAIYNKVFSILLTFIEQNKVDIERKEFSPCVIKAIQFIKHNLSAQLSVSQIADNAFVSKSTLTKRFQKELGISINRYLYDMIMLEAGQLLVNTNLSVLQISEKFGFSDQFYFSRKFKEKFGVSPREHRKNTGV